MKSLLKAFNPGEDGPVKKIDCIEPVGIYICAPPLINAEPCIPTEELYAELCYPPEQIYVCSISEHIGIH